MAEQKHSGGYCNSCEKEVMTVADKPRHGLHLVATLLTVGLWLIPWLLITIFNDPRARCTECGNVVLPGSKMRQKLTGGEDDGGGGLLGKLREWKRNRRRKKLKEKGLWREPEATRSEVRGAESSTELEKADVEDVDRDGGTQGSS